MSTPTRRKSDLATIEKISPNKTVPRTKTIRRNTPHCVAGNASLQAILGLANFQAGGGASCTYVIAGGKMGLGCEETNRPWTTSSSANDNEAITFEIANNGGAPDWRMSDADINVWLDASVEIAKFYGFKKYNYQDKPSNITGSVAVENWIKTWANADEMIITLHRWYAAKACPGDYFVRQIPWLVREMNKRLQDSNYVPEAFVGEGATLPTLSKGATGDGVKLAQQRLNLHGATPVITEDGDFGALTETAVKSFQTAKGLTSDGVVGAITWGELNKEPSTKLSSTTPSPSTTETSSSDAKTTTEYKVAITASALNVRKGPGVPKYPIVKTLVNDRNVYTIVEEADGPGASKWGKLKSGIGWISLDHTKKV